MTGQIGNSVNKTPFCGNIASQAGLNKVLVGKCGKCQVQEKGGGGKSKCNKNSNQQDCTTPNSCGGDQVCCESGECAEKAPEPMIGSNCST